VIEQSRNEKKLIAIERAKFRLKQRMEYIDFEYDVLRPVVSEFKAKARLPELPSELIVEMVKDETDTHQAKPSKTAKGVRSGHRK